MTRLEAIRVLYYLCEGHWGEDYYPIQEKLDRGRNGDNIRFTKYQKEFLAYKFENTMLDKEDVEALEIITGSKDWLPELRDWN